MNSTLYRIFIIPSLVVVGLVAYGAARYLGTDPLLADAIILSTIVVGSIELIVETVRSIVRGHFALDYIALAAIVTGLITHEYMVTGIIVLMLSGGTTLEHYAGMRARTTLSLLKNRIPHYVVREIEGREERIPIAEASVGDSICVRTGEVVPLDGVVLSQSAVIDESSLTGEPYSVVKQSGSIVKSGTVNQGSVMRMRVEKVDADSTYRRIVALVERAEHEKSPLVRLADRYSVIFAIITALLAVGAYIFSGDSARILAVLVMATPCPLLLATPIALLGGVNSALKKQIIIKNVAGLEILDRADTLVFDKTGTITLGSPKITAIKVHDHRYSQRDVLARARALEQNSLHPFAQAVIAQADTAHAPLLSATHAREQPGTGISGHIDGKLYAISKAAMSETMAADLYEGKHKIATFSFEDVVKPGTRQTIKELHERAYSIFLCTGDTAAAAVRTASSLGGSITVKANFSPADKQALIQDLKQQKRTVIMVGDGINDAPALAQADLGMVFSHSEQTAASEAADVVFLGGNIDAVAQSILIAKRTISIAKTSIIVGMVLSALGMIMAAYGYIPPLIGALLQEGIDILVILYALRAVR